MTNQEIEHRKEHQRKQLEKRKKKLRKKIIKNTCLVVLGIVVLLSVVGVHSKVVAHQKAVEVAKQEEAAKKKAAEEKAAEEKAKAEALANDPRLNYALDPNVPAGSDTQSEEKIVYLTFDDGPSANTENILATLDQYNAKATFFVTALNPEYKDLIKDEYDRGHTVGLHTYSHDYSAIYSSTDAYFEDLDQIGQYVKDEIGYVPCFLRFPGGSSNTVSAQYSQGIMSTLSTEVLTKGYQYYDWNSDCGDASASNVPTDAIIKRACNDVPTNIVMLLHDARGKETTAEALPKIIESYQAQGYTFKALDRESFDSHHQITN